MRRILYLITELDAGGAEKALYELVTRLDTRRFDPLVGCLTGRGVVGEWLADAGIEVRHFDMRGCWDLPAWTRLRRTLKHFRPHVVHAYLFHANLISRLASVGLGIERVISSVRVEEPRWTHLWLDRLTCRLVDRVTCVSASTRDYTHARARIPLEKLVVVPNGIDPQRCDMPVMAPPPQWRIPDTAPVIAVIGRLHAQKDPLAMLRVAQAVIAEIPNAVFVFAGDGPLADQCRTDAHARRIADNVRFLGWVPDVRPLLARMDLLALTSRWEGMPNVVLEAMACRKPVIASAVGGCVEQIANGETGFLVPPGDTDATVRRILTLLSNTELRKQMGTAGRKRLLEHFSIEKTVQANQALYEA